MSALPPSPLMPVIVPFARGLVSVSTLSPTTLAHLLQRGVAAIVHSFSMAYLSTADLETALASAQSTSDRFQQFVVQATAEKLNTSLLCEAFSFALRGTTFSRIIDGIPELTNAQKNMLFRVHAEHQRFVDRLCASAESGLLQPLTTFVTIGLD